jgi:hypothetical protein
MCLVASQMTNDKWEKLKPVGGHAYIYISVVVTWVDAVVVMVVGNEEGVAAKVVDMESALLPLTQSLALSRLQTLLKLSNILRPQLQLPRI